MGNAIGEAKASQEAWVSRLAAATFALLLVMVGPVPALEYGVDPMPALVLDDNRAGESPEHRLRVSVTAGELETYQASVQYPEGFRFEGFLRFGALNSPVGLYQLDFNEDGEADVSMEIRSTGRSSAYIDVIADGRFSSGLEPTVSISSTARVGITLPMGGDALSTTLTVPQDAMATVTLFAGVLRSPTSEGFYKIDARLVSVDPDTDGPSDGVAPDPLEFEATLDVEILSGSEAFASLEVSRALIRIQRPGRDWFQVRGRFDLGADSDRIDPATEGVEVHFGPFSQRIEGSSIRKRRRRHVFTGRNGVSSLVLRPDGRFFIQVRSIDLSGLDLSVPVPFAMRIGNDHGEVDIAFSSKGRFPADGGK